MSLKDCLTFQVLSEDVRLFDKVVFEIDGVPREQMLWPRHCIQESWGAELHPSLMVRAYKYGGMWAVAVIFY